MMKHKVLTTKKLDASLHQKARENQIELIEKEFISIQPVWNQKTIDHIKGAVAIISDLVFTSANSVSVLCSNLPATDEFFSKKRTIFCLSGATKKSLEQSPFPQNQIKLAGRNGIELAENIIKANVSSVIFFCGRQRRNELPDILSEAGITVQEIVLYETLAQPEKLQEDFDAVMFYSPSGVNSFFSSNQLKKNAVCFAIGPTSTFEAIASVTKNKIIHSEEPNPALLLEKVIEYFN